MSCCSEDCSYKYLKQDYCEPNGADWKAAGVAGQRIHAWTRPLCKS